MSTVAESLISEMHDRLQLVSNQSRAGLNAATLLDNAANAFAASIGTHGMLDLAGQAAVTDAVVSADWSDAHKGMLVTVLGQEAHDPDQAPKRKTQVCPNIEAFFPATIWATMESVGLSLYAKLVAVATFLQASLNISCPAIPLLQRVIAIVTEVHPGPDLDTGARKAWAARKLKSLIKEGDAKKKARVATHRVIPCRPIELARSNSQPCIW